MRARLTQHEAYTALCKAYNLEPRERHAFILGQPDHPNLCVVEADGIHVASKLRIEDEPAVEANND